MDNKIKLNIGGVDLILKTNEDPKYMQQLADEVNTRIRELTRNNSYVSTTMASVITALEYCDKLKKNNNEIGGMNCDISKLETEIIELRLEAEQARREIERINNENKSLRAKLSRK